MAKRLGVLSLLALLSALVLGAGSANAAQSGFAICAGSGKLSAFDTKPASWTVSGSGNCFGPREPRKLSFSGSGTSASLGLCSPGHLLVQNLRLWVLVTQTGVNTGNVKTEGQIWSAPITTFPLATPFFVSGPNSAFRGAGLAIHHIFLNCGNDGNMPSAEFAWSTLR